MACRPYYPCNPCGPVPFPCPAPCPGPCPSPCGCTGPTGPTGPKAQSPTYFLQAQLSAAPQSVPVTVSTTTPGIIGFNAVRSGNANGAFNTVTSSFTAPFAGAYFVSVPIGFAFNGAVASSLDFYINVNGIAVALNTQTINFAIAGSLFSTSLSSVVSLNVGDVVTVTGLSTAAGAQVNYTSNTLPFPGQTSLSIYSLF